MGIGLLNNSKLLMTAYLLPTYSSSPTTRYSQLTHLLNTAYHDYLPLTTPYSPLATHYSLLTTHYSPLTPHSALPTPHSSLITDH